MSREVFEARDLALRLDASGMLGRERLDETPNPVADLEREVRCRRPDEGANVLHRDLAREAVGALRFAHGFVLVLGSSSVGKPTLPVPSWIGAISSSSSTCAWNPTLIAFASPASHAWL